MPQVYADESRRQACLSTQTKTFKLKSSETSNLMMVASLPAAKSMAGQGEILFQTSNFVELTSTQRRDHQVISLLKTEHSLFSEEGE
mmetsp:Transcript_25465/g.34017  ORF Transcript_25465/g.34017 Transcript_25465/m.34017 type:complete len:87 (-) Transcript_25465:855-1115(-)|eukprot:CAMPEP_0185567130 /NCGR_PEP_ID=MMETSP0434-20130131/499_1 /TAXON_ID=626734 ORGANISM="Favella taraikaensis, Strain Fe Narragansett Bay" /NCGR_SAMPLE_ID=MMETSP0434 /ASSEMBLY_ACC=CAM_ASM_000379 /LENGTH=86 /DNA_ID=CAMNT_0028181283 /DNA_START=218 /DNA_END=478 /DNA_ORIENTATION=+